MGNAWSPWSKIPIRSSRPTSLPDSPRPDPSQDPRDRWLSTSFGIGLKSAEHHLSDLEKHQLPPTKRRLPVCKPERFDPDSSWSPVGGDPENHENDPHLIDVFHCLNPEQPMFLRRV